MTVGICDTAKRIFGPINVCPEHGESGCGLCNKHGDVGAHYRSEIKEPCSPKPREVAREKPERLSRDLEEFVRSLAANFVGTDAVYLAAASAEKRLGKKGFCDRVMLVLAENRPSWQKEFMG